VTQHWRSARSTVRWADVTRAVIEPDGVRLSAPTGEFRLQIGPLHPELRYPLCEAIELWATSPSYLFEIADGSALDRILERRSRA